MNPRVATRLCLLGLCLLSAIGLWRVIAGLTLAVPLDPNEGWNAYHTAALMRGGALYPPAHAYIVNNYPPLSFYVVGAAGKLIGDYIFAGRIVSFLALGFILVALRAIARHMGARRDAALLPSLLFLTVLILFSDYAGMDDPQMLAHAVALGGLWVLLARPRTRQRLALSAVLFVASIFVKHNIIALPATAFLWLLYVDRKAAGYFLGFGIAFLSMGLGLFHLLYGVSLLSVVATARMYSTEQLFEMGGAWLTAMAGPLLGFVLLAGRFYRKPYVVFCIGYAITSIALGLAFLGGAGVDANAMFEADIALGLSGGLLISYLPGWRKAIASAAYVLPFLFFAARNDDWKVANLQLHPFRAESAIASGDIAFMKAQKGPGLCEMLSFCYWAGKPPAVDFFNVGQQFDTGVRSDAEIAALVEAKHYAVIQFDPDSPYSLGEAVHDAMERSYRIHHSDWYGTFYVPK
ncbi:MFS family permease [Rhizomicrobium palustre]|uniref:MFS family permease n=1 Tax=Rhizomicrobium palustre TaxID=189966 RepID=A0A846MYJ5_9PROT|nr:glycosyltransferase family 39 protein [Rhizomicrobium palustre]NIK88037.1 MFS family permease [Rhizomicrobium palustre]